MWRFEFLWDGPLGCALHPCTELLLCSGVPSTQCRDGPNQPSLSLCSLITTVNYFRPLEKFGKNHPKHLVLRDSEQGGAAVPPRLHMKHCGCAPSPLTPPLHICCSSACCLHEHYHITVPWGFRFTQIQHSVCTFCNFLSFFTQHWF